MTARASSAAAPAALASAAEGESLVVAWAVSDADDLLRRVVGQFCAVPAGEVTVARLCPGCGSVGHGRPQVTVAGRPGPHVSVSRTDGLVCVAVTGAGPVGVDCERSGAAAFGEFEAVGLHPLERSSGAQEQTITWVRKESLVKATGAGLSVDLRLVRLSEPGELPALLAWDAPSPLSPLGERVWMRDVVGPRGYVLAVSVLTALEPQITVVAAAGEALAAPVAQPPPAAPAAPGHPATRGTADAGLRP